jgi:hypothetical protein
LRRYLGYAVLLIFVLTVLALVFIAFIQPNLQSALNVSILIIINAIIVIISVLSGFKNVVEFVRGIFDKRGKQFTLSIAEQKHIREILLARVRDNWIEGVLKKSLYNEMKIEIGFELLPDAVEHPWNTVLQMPDITTSPIPCNKKILEVFNDTSQSLIILGESGAGKTTALLELASQSIQLAEKDLDKKIPVVFNLLTWTPNKKIQAWILDEFYYRYKIPPYIGKYWVENNKLMFLLDGLDEVKEEYRNKCVQEINNFLADQIISIAICCRKNEYGMLEKKVDLQGGILLQPLSSEQTRKYLQRAGHKFIAIFNSFNKDAQTDFRDFLNTPLMISIFLLAYKNASIQEIIMLVKSKDKRKQLFDFYINQMFKRRGKSYIYTEEQTKNWLTWLANQMMEKGLSEFHIEDIQSNWIGISKRKKNVVILSTYSLMLMGFVIGIFLGYEWLILGVFLGVIFFSIARIDYDKNPAYKIKWSWTWGKVNYGIRGIIKDEIALHDKPDLSIRNSLRNFVVVFLMASLIMGLLFGLLAGLIGVILEGGYLFNFVAFGIIGPIMGLVAGLDYGGAFLIFHFLLRWQLYRANKLPFKLITFLDFATERVFLRKVGGGYIFIHRMLMEHFAEMKNNVG